MQRDFVTNNYYRKKLTEKESAELQKKICRLAEDKDFIRDDSFNGIVATRHIMYKLQSLENADGQRKYEFLVEMDKNDSDLGIYYGCRGLFPTMDTQKAIEVFDEEWQKLKYECIYLLNNVFPSKDFSCRFRMTDNANDKTYWPFWLALYPDEDIVEVAARALKIIRNVYMRALSGEKFHNRVANDLKKNIPTETCYTNAAYDALVKSLTASKQDEAITLFEKLINVEMQRGRLLRSRCYECCWTVNMDNIEFAYLWVAFCERIGMIGEWKPESNEAVRIPWKKLVAVFVNKDNEPFYDNLKKQFSNHTDTICDRHVAISDRRKRIQIARHRLDEIFK